MNDQLVLAIATILFAGATFIRGEAHRRKVDRFLCGSAPDCSNRKPIPEGDS